MKSTPSSIALAVLAVSAQFALADPLGTAFTYQGRLADGGQPANGNYDLRFILYDAEIGGSRQGQILTNAGVAISQGLFTTALDFGATGFGGDARWLEIAVRTNGGGGFVPLQPRQALTPAPYAFYAPDAGLAAEAKSVSPGSVGSAALIAGSVGSLQVADGSLAPNDLGPALASNTFWRLGGNGGTTPALNFLGTLDATSLELRIANQPVLSIGYRTNDSGQLRPSMNAGCDNTLLAHGATIAGGSENSIGVDAWHCTIAGGSRNTIERWTTHSVVGGGYGNAIGLRAYNSLIAGGASNTNASTYSVISGGGRNNIRAESPYTTLAGGNANMIGLSSDHSTISGGESNTVSSAVTGATLAGGSLNQIGDNGRYAVIGGGMSNRIGPGANYATIGGGAQNVVEINSSDSVISGGENNAVARDVGHATIAGGLSNRIDRYARNASIGGGNVNRVGTNSIYSTIAGGCTNSIGIASLASTVGGGQNNFIGSYSTFATIAGGRNHSIGTNCLYAAIGGGYDHDIDANSAYTSIPGGYNNGIGIESDSGTVAGGENNQIGHASRYATIAGGRRNALGTNSPGSAIGGGSDNAVIGNTAYGTVAGGLRNQLGASAPCSTVGGGSDNTIAGNASYATIPGGRSALAVNYAQMAFAGGQFAAPGDAQSSTYVLRRSVNTGWSDEYSELFLNGTSGRITIGPDRAVVFDGLLIAFGQDHRTTGFRLFGLFKRVGNTTRKVWGWATSEYDESQMHDREARIEADDENDALIISVRNGTLWAGGPEGEVRWVATIRTAEVAW